MTVLAGCPGVTRLYIHNKSDDTLVAYGPRFDAEPTSIKPGRTKYVYPKRDDRGENVSVDLEIDGESRTYWFNLDMRMTAQGTGYGERMDAYYEYGRMFIEKEPGTWLEVKNDEL